MANTLNIGIALDLVTCVFFLYISYRVAQLSQQDHPMAKVFRWSQWFWLGTASFMLLDGGFAIWILRSDPGAPVPLLVLAVRRGLFLIGLTALTHLLLRMALGTSRHVPYLLSYATFMILAVEALTLYQNPLTYQQATWSIDIIASRETPAIFNFLIGVLLFGPVIVASLMTTRIVMRLPNREARYRLLVVSISVQTFAAGIIIGFWDNEWFWYGLFENRLVFSVATGMLIALRPPWFVRKYWNIPRLGSTANFPGKHLIPPRS